MNAVRIPHYNLSILTQLILGKNEINALYTIQQNFYE